MLDAVASAKQQNADLILFGELSVCGYPPRDFLEFDDFSMPDYFRFFREAPFQVGDMVKIDHPSFEGFELPVKDIRNHEVIFDLVLLNQTTELLVPVQNCYKAA